jgi:hypothetical protein
MYINVVADSVMLYLRHDCYNIIFKIKLYTASGSAPPSPRSEKFWVRTWWIINWEGRRRTFPHTRFSCNPGIWLAGGSNTMDTVSESGQCPYQHANRSPPKYTPSVRPASVPTNMQTAHLPNTHRQCVWPVSLPTCKPLTSQIHTVLCLEPTFSSWHRIVW